MSTIDSNGYLTEDVSENTGPFVVSIVWAQAVHTTIGDQSGVIDLIEPNIAETGLDLERLLDGLILRYLLI
ncbi:hypothetical protein [Halorubrum sp. HHNYT27]|uniref:hypothetical protein n=1 Tax=Halorubrum sp. HHNYT27 TaxID=3402275 RepID=UPI003EB881CE